MTISKSTVLKLGSKGPDVRALQMRLNALGIKDKRGKKLVEDGKFGDLTESSVENYQRKMKLKDDGIAAKITLTSLGLLHATSPPTKTKTTVSYNSDKDADLKAAANALGGKFNNLTGAYNLIKANEDYKKYFGDVKKWEEELKGNNNCVDWSQFLAKIMDKLNAVANLGYKYKYVRAYCEISKIWHVYLEVTGGEFGSSKVNVDGAAAASDGSKYPFGKAWCQNSKTKEYNPGYATKDDGI